MTVRLLTGDCRVIMATLPAASVQCVVTSPPYYGLRDYGLPPLVWAGDAEHEHAFGLVIPGDNRGGSGTFNGRNGAGEKYGRDAARGQCCACGAWLGSLGLEPTPELYVEHLCEVFREVWRVLRPDGTVWLNLGDSYAGSGNGQHDRRPADASPSMRQLGPIERGQLSNRAVSGQRNGAGPVHGYKPKDLMLLPWRVAMALQVEGWWIRSVIPWLKRNSMPESVTDRPAAATEYVFLLAKSARYYWDADAVRMAQSENTHSRGNGHTPKERPMGEGIKANSSFHEATKGQWLPNGRSRRNTDWWFESWQGLMLDEHDDPLALVVNPQPFKESHFATFPLKLVEPMVKAGSRPGDTILDPFGGSGTVGLVADRLGRDAIMCELKPDYGVMAVNRVTSEAPLFTQIDVV